MGIKYNPSDLVACLPEGEYPASIAAMAETTSKAGNDMIVVDFDVYAAGGVVKLKDYIVFPSTAYKLKRLATSTGRTAAFESGEFAPSQYTGANLVLLLKVESTAQYGDQNKIAGYKPSEAGTVPTSTAFAKPARQSATVKNPDPITDADIPF